MGVESFSLVVVRILRLILHQRIRNKTVIFSCKRKESKREKFKRKEILLQMTQTLKIETISILKETPISKPRRSQQQ